MRAAWHHFQAALAVANGYAALKGVKYRVLRGNDGLWRVHVTTKPVGS